jgi:hypothetical protein
MKSLIIIIALSFVSLFSINAQTDMQMSVANFQASTNFPAIDFKMDGYMVVGCQVIDTTGNEMRFLDIESGLTAIEDMTTLENDEYQIAIELFIDYMDNVSTHEDTDGNLWLQWVTADINNCNFLVCQILEDGFKVVATVPNSK